MVILGVWYKSDILPHPKPCKTTFVGVVLLSVKKKTAHHTAPNHHVITFKAVQSNLGSWFSVCNLNITQLEEIWMTTSIFLKMEEDLNIFENGRRPQYLWKFKTTSIFLKVEDNLNIFENVRRPQYFWKLKTTSICGI